MTAASIHADAEADAEADVDADNARSPCSNRIHVDKVKDLHGRMRRCASKCISKTPEFPGDLRIRGFGDLEFWRFRDWRFKFRFKFE